MHHIFAGLSGMLDLSDEKATFLSYGLANYDGILDHRGALFRP